MLFTILRLGRIVSRHQGRALRGAKRDLRKGRAERVAAFKESPEVAREAKRAAKAAQRAVKRAERAADSGDFDKILAAAIEVRSAIDQVNLAQHHLSQATGWRR